MDRTQPTIGAILAVVAVLAFAPTALAHEVSGKSGVTSSANARTAAAAPVIASQVQLSDETTFTTWAFVRRKVAAHTQPSNNSHVLKRLTTRTPDRTSELVVVLNEATLADGSVWDQVRLPMRPNNTVGWVPRKSLWTYHKIHTSIDISLNRKTLTVSRNGVKVWMTHVGVGKRGTATPRGEFYIRDRLIPFDKHGVYGPFAFGMSAYSKTLTDWPGGGMVGIHGTDQPSLIPGRISHGCVRLRNAKILTLKRLVSVGTPIRIH
jgi:lipoprotein-anchoring transpeptidase ErfK/SrfK